jgi:hypothetical protein
MSSSCARLQVQRPWRVHQPVEDDEKESDMGLFGKDNEVQKLAAEAYRDLLGVQQERDRAIAAWRQEQLLKPSDRS